MVNSYPLGFLWSPRCSLGNPLRPVTPCMLSDETLGSADFFPGCRVLARRELDGLYYLGKVLHESCRGVWVVEFDHPGGVGLGISSSWQQLVCSPDMVNHSRAHTRCLAPGDAVLSPWEPELWRYGPGIVMAGRQHRESDGAPGLRVRMWNGCVSVVPGNLAVYITASHHDRISRELHVAASAPSHHCNWPCVHSPACAPWLCCTECCQSPPASCCCPGVDQWPGRATPTSARSLGSMDVFSRAERDKKDDLKHTNTGKSEPSPSSSSEAETRGEFPAVVKIRIKQQCPPWRYWRRNGPEPQHHLPGEEHFLCSLIQPELS
uniref:DUF4537 domain-containing protein n=1 Tax=Myripristis murdjan TaxID=586833 RepID=A0A667ZBX4_9TELE